MEGFAGRTRRGDVGFRWLGWRTALAISPLSISPLNTSGLRERFQIYGVRARA